MMRIDEGILRLQDMLCQSFETNGFMCHFVETDGDTGVSSIHKGTFRRYEKFDVNVSFADGVKELTKTGALMKWPVSDLLHLRENARWNMVASRNMTYGSISSENGLQEGWSHLSPGLPCQ
jgi:hypothetical protein